MSVQPDKALDLGNYWANPALLFREYPFRSNHNLCLFYCKLNLLLQLHLHFY